MSVDTQYLYILIEDDGHDTKLVRSFTPEEDKQTYYGGNARSVRVYVTEKRARREAKKLPNSKILRVDISDGEIIT